MNNTKDPSQLFADMYALSQGDSDHAVQMALSLIGIVANFLLINAHIKDPLKTFMTTSSLFILNIAATDFIMSLAYFISSLTLLTVSTQDQNNSLKLVYAIITVWSAFMTISFPSFLSLSIERFCSVAFPLWHRVRITVRACRYCLCTMWLVHFGMEVLNISLILSFANCYEESGIVRLAYMSLTFFLTQLFYLGTYFSLKKQRRELLAYQDVGGVTCRALKLRLENEKNFLFTIAIVCSIQAVTLLPVLSTILLNFLSPNVRTKYIQTASFLTWLFIVSLCVNSAVNPLIYLWRFPKYRKTFKKLYCNVLNNRSN